MKLKSTVFFLFFIFCISFLNSIPGYSIDRKLYKVKVYISKDAIEIQDDMIAIRVDEDLIPVNGIFCDTKGLNILIGIA